MLKHKCEIGFAWVSFVQKILTNKLLWSARELDGIKDCSR